MESNGRVECTDPFSEIAGQIIAKLDEIGDVVDYDELERWADGKGIGKYTLRMVLNDLVEQGAAVAPEGFCEEGCGFEPPKPKKIGVRKADPRDVERVKAYLAEYWSVGLFRLFDDMSRIGVKNVNEALKEVIRLGYAELSRIGVVNAFPLRATGKKG
ncbi:MAG: hypothetical protein QFX34_03465 [Candidatus Verstraetearchaeota archaeon]|nr:hypothetical protein [Candidatus Verstraetearchaeota archaeon]